MNLDISKKWLLEMAEKEINGIFSVGGLVVKIKEIEDCGIRK